jgi:Putative sensor
VPTWFVALVTVRSLCLGLVITPFVIPVLIVLGLMTRGFAAVEAELARSLLDLEANMPSTRPSRPGFWAWLRAQFDSGFWRAQGYLVLRWFAGFPVAIAMVTLLSVALGMLFAPAWLPFVHYGAELGFWKPHTLVQSLLFVPLGAILLPAGVLVARALAVPFAALASSLLTTDTEPPEIAAGSTAASTADGSRPGSLPRARSRYALEVHAAVDAVIVFALLLIWALVSRGYF